VSEAKPRAVPAARPDVTPRRAQTVARNDDTVHLGVTNPMHTEWFYLLIQGSWPRFFGVLTGAVLALNVLFALAYAAVPDQLVNFDGSLSSAFAFSVQTLFTIGYGAMAPTGWVAHTLVTLEAIVGMMFSAVVTGLVFARVSRPHSRVLFSDVVVVAPMDGVPTFSFRLANARGNEVLDASIRIVALIDTVTREGHRIRRMHELHPERTYSPIFRMSWTVMHRLDARSPLAPYVQDGVVDPRVIGFVCLLTAHDATLHASLHTQHVYAPTDLRFGVKFVDVVSRMDDGRFVLDYTRFHDTEPLEGDPPGGLV
jgi:inward rectifier potassium channel